MFAKAICERFGQLGRNRDELGQPFALWSIRGADRSINPLIVYQREIGTPWQGEA
jgi:hypothetical protein